jgi:serine/threonine protein kinase/tetratricopeptide (TPR) repeat protein
MIPGDAKLGPYRVIAPLASGGMSEVYRALDERLGREVAIKILPKHLQQDEDALARFEREAKVISGLNHPHILTIHGIGRNRVRGDYRATSYMVTELIEGVTLREAMAQESDGRKLIETMIQVAGALQKAHSVGVIHRDLKPENIMISNDGYAKVLDFGLAKFVGPSPERESDAAKTERARTQQGTVIGTLGYMSPEQVQGRAVDHRSDIFSFGCILYELLSGRRAFEADSAFDILNGIVHGAPAPLLQQTPAMLRAIAMKCLEKKPEQRYDDMRSVASALSDALRDTDGVVRAPAKRTRAVSTRSSTRIKSLAIMPFANSSDDPEMEYLSDGITESIVHSLSRVGRRLRVIARSTVFAYKSKPYTPPQLAVELGVGAIVTGRVQRVRDDLVISVELVNTSDGSVIWGDRFRTPFSDIFSVQDEIAAQVAEQLRLRLTTTEKKLLGKRVTNKSEAYELYLRGRFYAHKRTIEGVRRAIENFEKAIAVDPAYALAHAGLADCHFLLCARFLAPPMEGYGQAEGEARRAVQLDRTLAEPHATIAVISFLYKWDWAEADLEFRRAIALNASYGTAHHWYSIFLAFMNHPEEALREGRIASELEPLSTIMSLNYADLLFFLERYEESLDCVRRTVDFESYFLAHLLVARIYVAQGKHKEAITEIEMAIAMEGRYPELLAALGSAYGAMGEIDRARAVLDELQTIAAQEFVAPIFPAEVAMAIGDYDRALRHAEEFLRMRGEVSELVAAPRFAALRRDSRFAEMLRSVGFPDRLPPGSSPDGDAGEQTNTP